MLQPRDYQSAFAADAEAWVQAAGGAHRRRLYAAPTGAGKSVCELLLLDHLPNALLVTPRLEIVAGMLGKLGVDTSSWSDSRLAAEALARRITTPIRACNLLARGELPFRPDAVILDEAHHDLADSYRDLSAYLGPVPWVGLTATPYRGTPAQTVELHDRWGGEITWIISLAQSVERGYLSVPEPVVWPLVDDDEIEVQNGEIAVRQAGQAVRDRLEEVAARCREFAAAGRWDRPTMLAVPSTACVPAMMEVLESIGLPAVGVTQHTTRPDRLRAFAAVARAEAALVQIDVVSEGVDLPIRRLIDLKPTLSPVRWLQQVGRITRPVADGERPPEYYCCCRNLERHGYLFEGLLPARRVAESQRAFGGPTRRASVRALGLEGLGRFAAAEVPLAGGLTGHLYSLVSISGFDRVEYAVLVHPLSAEVLYATRTSTRDSGDSVRWGRWRRIDRLPDLRGFASAAARPLSEKQAAWWSRDAERFGLDPAAKPNRRSFAALPVLRDLGLRMGVSNG